MDIRCLGRKAALIGVTAAMSLLSFGCNSGFSDPFWTRPAGQKFTVPASSSDRMPLDSYSDAFETRATLLKIGRQVDVGSSRSSLSSLDSGQSVIFKSLTIIGKNGLSSSYDMERIKKINNTAECQSISSDIKEVLISYPDLILVCGAEFTDSFRTAASVSLITTDGVERSFTNWGVNFSEGSGYRVVIQSLIF